MSGKIAPASETRIYGFHADAPTYAASVANASEQSILPKCRMQFNCASGANGGSVPIYALMQSLKISAHRAKGARFYGGLLSY